MHFPPHLPPATWLLSSAVRGALGGGAPPPWPGHHWLAVGGRARGLGSRRPASPWLVGKELRWALLYHVFPSDAPGSVAAVDDGVLLAACLCVPVLQRTDIDRQAWHQDMLLKGVLMEARRRVEQQPQGLACSLGPQGLLLLALCLEQMGLSWSSLHPLLLALPPEELQRVAVPLLLLLAQHSAQAVWAEAGQVLGTQPRSPPGSRVQQGSLLVGDPLLPLVLAALGSPR
ncbi:hypothetical protein V8C86DRAFT_3021928, partial [Haematococcus lacustris]